MVKADRRKSSKIKVHLSSGLEMKQLNKVSRTARLAVSRTGSKCAYNQWNFNRFAMCSEDIEKIQKRHYFSSACFYALRLAS